MGIIGEVKCARCDRKYSGVRSRCPYCGARRIGRGKYTEDSDNSKGKMLIGILILAVLVVAAGVLLLTSDKPSPPDVGLNEGSHSPNVSMPDDLDTTKVNSDDTVPPPSTATSDGDDGDEPSASPETMEIVSLTITYSGRPIPNNDFTAKIGEKVPLRARIEPVGIDEPVIWTSSNTGVFQVVADNVEGTSAMVTGIGVGTATLTISVGGKESTCIVRVN